MRSGEQAISALVERYRAFTLDPSLRAMHVQASPSLLPTLVGLLVALETRMPVPSPVLMLLTPARGADHWRKRDTELRREYEHLRAAASNAQLGLRELPPPSRGEGILVFANTMRAVIDRVTSPLAGPTFLIVPSSQAEAAFGADLKHLLQSDAMARARVVVVESGTSAAGAVASLGARSVMHQAEIAPADLSNDLEAMAEVARRAAASADPAGAHVGGAAPSALPPLRPHEAARAALDPEILRSVGVSLADVDPGVGARIRAAVLTAFAAGVRQDRALAIRHYMEARDVALEAGRSRDAVTFEMLAGATALEGAPTAALATFAAARDRAVTANLPELGARAEMGRAAALLSLRRDREAPAAYALAADLAEGCSPIDAIEALRMLGTLELHAGREAAAAASWKRALAVAGALDEATSKATSAALVARSLAQLCRRHGLAEQARSLDAQAAHLERPLDLRSVRGKQNGEGGAC